MPLGKKVNFKKNKPYPGEIYEHYVKNTGLDFELYFLAENADGSHITYGISEAQLERLQKQMQVSLAENLHEFSNDNGVLHFSHITLGSFTIEYEAQGLVVDTTNNVFGYLEWAMIATLADLGSTDHIPLDSWYRKPWEEIQDQEGISEKLMQLQMKEMEILAFRSMLEKNLDIYVQDILELTKVKIYSGDQELYDKTPFHSEYNLKEVYQKLMDSINQMKGQFA